MTIDAYEAARKRTNTHSGADIVVSFGAHGEQFAITRFSPRGSLQVKIWREDTMNKHFNNGDETK